MNEIYIPCYDITMGNVIQNHFVKIIKCINSCTTKDHLDSCTRIVYTFHKLHNNMDLTKHLMVNLNTKEDNI
jgi:hypothetical protein